MVDDEDPMLVKFVYLANLEKYLQKEGKTREEIKSNITKLQVDLNDDGVAEEIEALRIASSNWEKTKKPELIVNYHEKCDPLSENVVYENIMETIKHWSQIKSAENADSTAKFLWSDNTPVFMYDEGLPEKDRDDFYRDVWNTLFVICKQKLNKN